MHDSIRLDLYASFFIYSNNNTLVRVHCVIIFVRVNRVTLEDHDVQTRCEQIFIENFLFF